MPGLSFRLPHTPADSDASETVEAVLARAVAEAEDVGGAFSTSPCAFRTVPGIAEASDLGEVAWVLVTHARSPEPDHEAHLRERSRTAVQRFMLSVQCDGFDALWVSDEDAVQAAFEGARLDATQAAPMGLVRCARLD